MWIMAAVTFASLPLLVGIKAQDPVPVEGKKNRDKHKHVEPVTPAPAPDIEPTPDPEFINVVPDPAERPRPRPDRVEPERRPVTPVAPGKPIVIYRGGWSSWFGGVFCGLTLGIVGSWLASLANVGAWIKRLLGK